MAKPTGFGGRDYPDFGVSTVSSSILAITDLSELVARLDGINTFERTGNVLYQEDFSAGLAGWESTYYPASAYPQVNARWIAHKPYSIYLHTTALIDSYSAVTKAFPYPHISLFGMECHFKAVTTFPTLTFAFNITDGSYYSQPNIVISSIDNTIKLLNAGNTYQTIGTPNIYTGVYSPFHIFKIVINLDTRKYVRAVFDEFDYSIPTIGLYITPDTTAPMITIQMKLSTATADAYGLCVTNVIITTNEPK